MEELIWSAAEGVAPGAALRRWSAQRLVAMVLNGLSPLEAQQRLPPRATPTRFDHPHARSGGSASTIPSTGRQARHARQRRERRTPVVVHRLFDDGGRVTRRRRVCPYRRHRSSGPLTGRSSLFLIISGSEAIVTTTSGGLKAKTRQVVRLGESMLRVETSDIRFALSAIH